MRVFSGFYVAVALATFVLQLLLTRVDVSRLDFARAVATLPATVALGGFGTLVARTAAVAGAARGAEAVVRNSVFRSGYEILFVPLPPNASM